MDEFTNRWEKVTRESEKKNNRPEQKQNQTKKKDIWAVNYVVVNGNKKKYKRDKSIAPGKCVFPFLSNYVFNNEPVATDPPFGLTVPSGATGNKWCATSVNANFEPLTIAFYDQKRLGRNYTRNFQ